MISPSPSLSLKSSIAIIYNHYSLLSFSSLPFLSNTQNHTPRSGLRLFPSAHFTSSTLQAASCKRHEQRTMTRNNIRTLKITVQHRGSFTCFGQHSHIPTHTCRDSNHTPHTIFFFNCTLSQQVSYQTQVLIINFKVRVAG